MKPATRHPSRYASPVPSCFESLESRRLCSAGDLDATFGAGGKVLAQSVGFAIADLAVQADGKAVVVGKLNGDFAVARLNVDGKLDKSFGGDGMASADFGGEFGDVATAVAIQPDGKIVVAGTREHQDLNVVNSVYDRFAVARFNTNGSLDNTFDGNGRLTVDFGEHPAQAAALAIQPNGRILVAGTVDTGGVIDDSVFSPVAFRHDFAVARLMPNGALDNTFGASVPIGNTRTGKTIIGFGGDDNLEAARVIAAAPDGKIVVGGEGGFGASRWAIARLNNNGTFDGSFTDGISGAGKFNNLYPDGGNLKDLQVQPDGSIFAVGSTKGNVAVARITTGGKLDKSFNGTGHVETDLGGNDEAKTVRVSREGVLVAGGSSGKFALVRYRANGSRDATFGQDGKVTTAVGDNDAILATTLTSDGKITAYGRSGGAARYFSAIPNVNVFSLDPSASESPGNPASLTFTRDLRLSFETRVYFTLGGTATLGTDYTGPSLLKSSTTGFVIIPANETTVTVPINLIDDTLREQGETVQVTLQSSPLHTVGDRATQTVSIADNDQVIANVASARTAAPAASSRAMSLFSDDRIDLLN